MGGADRDALSAVRLTRLPGCERLGREDKAGGEPFSESNKANITRICFWLWRDAVLRAAKELHWTTSRRSTHKPTLSIYHSLRQGYRVGKGLSRRCATQKQTLTGDFVGGVEDKRLLVIETEFARPLKAMARPGNILSTVMRDAWDGGKFQTLTRSNPISATDAHISIIGHITKEELGRELDECDVWNGFANRFLWPEVERSRLLPEGGQIDPEVLKGFALRLQQSLARARGVTQMTRDSEAREHWHSVYTDLSAELPGMLGVVINRAEAQVLRISMVLALSDGSEVIKLAHQKAALAFWDYCFASARRLFGHRLSDSKAQKILEELRGRPQGMTRKQILDEIFGRSISVERLTSAFKVLLDVKLARYVIEPTGGRSAERWFAVTP